MQLNDTIVALSSPPSVPILGSREGGVRGIVRLSGPDAWGLAREVAELPAEAGVGWHPVVLRCLPGVPGLASAILFKGPRSFTGEDVAELHLPNSPGVLRWVIDRILAGGKVSAEGGSPAVRMAEPGEFSARAFFNGKMDLTQAEGVAATIDAENETQLRAAASLRSGDLYKWTHAAADRLANLLALVEAGIDFSDEEGIHFIDASQLETKLAELAGHIEQQLEASVRIDRLAVPPTVVFIGKPNVGKSSLINALAGRERSIVSPVAGTTRDMLTVAMSADEAGGCGGEIRLVDVPGEEPAADELREKMMAARANALLDADLIVEVMDGSLIGGGAETGRREEEGMRRMVVWNKADLVPGVNRREEEGHWWVSAKTGVGVAELRTTLMRMAMRDAGGARGTVGAERLVLNHRHRAILQEAMGGLERARRLLERGGVERHPELLAAELRRMLDVLGQMTGAISPDEVLGRIFSTFCIGK